MEQDSGIGEIFELSVAIRQEAGRALALLWRSVEFEELIAQDGQARVVFTPEQLAAVSPISAAKASGVSLATEFESAARTTSSWSWTIKQWGRTSDIHPELPSDIREVIGSLIRSLTEGLAFVEIFKTEIDEIVSRVNTDGSISFEALAARFGTERHPLSRDALNRAKAAVDPNADWLRMTEHFLRERAGDRRRDERLFAL